MASSMGVLVLLLAACCLVAASTTYHPPPPTAAAQKQAASLLASTPLLFHSADRDGALFVTQSKQFSVQVHGAGFALARPRQTDVLTVDLVDAQPAPLTGEQRHGDAVVNYFRGKDASQWRSGVPVWERVRARRRYGLLHINRRTAEVRL